MGKRKRENTVPEADKALKSPRMYRQTVGGKLLESMGLLHLQVQAVAAAPSETEGIGDIEPCHHMGFDDESVGMAVYEIEFSREVPNCHFPGCRITWKGAGESKEGMMKCMECHYIACAGWPVDRDDPQGHAFGHAEDTEHHVAQWYDDPRLGYCFECACAMRLTGGQDQSSNDEVSDVNTIVDDERGMVASKTIEQQGMVASKTIKQQGMVASNTIDQQGMVASTSKVDSETVASNYKVDLEMLASYAMDQKVPRDDASGYATEDDHVIRGMPNHGNTCYVNALLQCLLALGKLRTTILGPDARLGEIGLQLRQLFVETSSGNNARHMLDPQIILVSIRSLYEDRFKAGDMEDSHEFLTSLCLQFRTIVDSIFSCKLIQTVSCKRCSRYSVTSHSSDGLQLAVPSKDPPARTKPLQVDSCEVKDDVHGCLQTQKNDVPRKIIEMRTEALDFIPNLFDDTEDIKEPAADSHSREDKEKFQSSVIVHDEAEHMNSLESMEDCLKLFSHSPMECLDCSNIAAVLPETNGTKIAEPVMASTNVNTTVDGDQTDGNGSATQTQLISKLPSVLTIQLKRFTSIISKLSGHVSFKEILHLGPFMDPSSVDKDKSSYRLVGVIEHLGETLTKGHYVAYVRGCGSSSWVCANDLIVKEVSLEQVLKREAYILFYERIEGN